VTEPACRWCGRRFAPTRGAGRPRIYCKRSCRQRDYEARQRALELGLGEHELVMTRDELNATRDRMYVLERTLEDADEDLSHPEARRAKELRRILEYVLDTLRICVTP
jgi:hypothetical protein